MKLQSISKEAPKKPDSETREEVPYYASISHSSIEGTLPVKILLLLVSFVFILVTWIYCIQLKLSTSMETHVRRDRTIATLNEKFCVAKVDTGNVSAASVIDEQGHFNLTLPQDFSGVAQLKCTRYNLTTGIARSNTTSFVPVSGSDYKPTCATRGVFKHGYFDNTTRRWNDG